MSQSKVNVELTIKTTLTLDDAGDVQAVTVENTGNIPRGAVRAIAAEAIASYFGMTDSGHGYRVQMSPELEEGETTVFEVYKSIIGTRK